MVVRRPSFALVRPSVNLVKVPSCAVSGLLMGVLYNPKVEDSTNRCLYLYTCNSEIRAMNRLERLLLSALLEYIELHGATSRAREALKCLGEREFAKHQKRLEARLKEMTKH